MRIELNWIELGKKKLHKNREIVIEWAVGAPRAWWQRAQIGASPDTKYKRSRIVFTAISIALSLGQLGPRMLGLAAQSLKKWVPVPSWAVKKERKKGGAERREAQAICKCTGLMLQGKWLNEEIARNQIKRFTQCIKFPRALLHMLS